MTDRERLEDVKAKVMSEKDSYERMKKENVLEKLLIATDEKTGKLWEQHIIPLYEHDVEFLKKVLDELGYVPEYKEEFNAFWQTTCCVVTL